MLKALTLAAVVLTGTPALALTLSPAPTRDQAQHLKPEQGSRGPDLRDTWAGGHRPLAVGGYAGATPTYGDSRVASFGGVATSLRVERDVTRYGVGNPDRRWLGLRDSFPAAGYIHRRR